MTEAQSRNTQAPPDAEPETRKSRHWWFWPLVIVLVLLLVPPLLLVVAVLLALRSETGTAWVIEQVPGLRTEAAEGSMLGGQWRADGLVWQGYGVGVQVSEPEIDWSPSCLLELTVCLDTLKAASIAVTVQESPPDQADQPRGDIQLPSVNLPPLGVNIREVRLGGALTVNDNLVWNRVELDSRASGATLNIDHLLYERGDILVTANGRARCVGTGH